VEGVAAQAQEFLEDEAAVSAALEQDRARRADLGELRDAFEDFRSGKLELQDLAGRLEGPLNAAFRPASGGPELALWGLEDEDERAFPARIAEMAERHPDLELSSVVRGHLEDLPKSDKERIQQLLAFGELIASVDAQGHEADPRLGVGPAASFMTFSWHCLRSGKEPVFLFASNTAIKAIARSGALGGAGSARDLEQRFRTFYQIARALDDPLAAAPKLMRAGWAVEHALGWIRARVEGIPTRGSAQRSGMWQPPSRERLRELRGEGPTISPPTSAEGPQITSSEASAVSAGPSISPPKSGSMRRPGPTIEPPRAVTADESSIEAEPLEGSRVAAEPAHDESDLELDPLEEGSEDDPKSSGVIDLGSKSDFELPPLADSSEEASAFREDSELEVDPLEGSGAEFAEDSQIELESLSGEESGEDDSFELEDMSDDSESFRFDDAEDEEEEEILDGGDFEEDDEDEAEEEDEGEAGAPQEPRLVAPEPDRFGDSAKRSKRKVVYADTQVLATSGGSLEDALPEDRSESPFFLNKSPRADDAKQEREAREKSRRKAETRRLQRQRAEEKARAEVEERARAVVERKRAEDEESEREAKRLAKLRAAEKLAAKIAREARAAAEAAGVEVQYAPEVESAVDEDPSSELLRVLSDGPIDPGESAEGSDLLDPLPLVPQPEPDKSQTRRYQAGEAPVAAPDAPEPTLVEPEPEPERDPARERAPETVEVLPPRSGIMDDLVSEFRGEVLEASRSFEDNGADDGPRIARGLHLSNELWFDMEAALDERGAVLLTGPVLSGKTYVARRLAIHRAGHEDRTLMVRLHPDLAYEDLVDGREGPGLLRAFCDRASEDPRQAYVLVLDEIDRGDAGRALGELLGALVERGRPVRLARSQAVFTVPRNLLVIATARELPPDPALAGRFPVVGHPGDAKILERFLAHRCPGMEWVAELLAALNSRLAEHSLELGHGPFMIPDLDANRCEGIWRREVLPWVRSQGVSERGLSFQELRPRGVAARG
jgi:dynein-related subfamily AAA family protein